MAVAQIPLISSAPRANMKPKHWLLVLAGLLILCRVWMFSHRQSLDYQRSHSTEWLPATPIHALCPTCHRVVFFTLVLNGMPFLRYHPRLMLQLDPAIAWEWHFVEGAAALTGDTAWSAAAGGRVDQSFMTPRGLSTDGTTEFLDQLALDFPGQVHIHRKAQSIPDGPIEVYLWQGKTEMCNAALQSVAFPVTDGPTGMLIQVDVDELWRKESIEAALNVLVQNPQLLTLRVHCHYFVGPELLTTELGTWAHNSYEWRRIWRLKRRSVWLTHEPPVISLDGVQVDPDHTGHVMMPDEAAKLGIGFTHFSYTTEAQLRFKERYYGMADAVQNWHRLQAAGQSEDSVSVSQYLGTGGSQRAVRLSRPNQPPIIGHQIPITRFVDYLGTPVTLLPWSPGQPFIPVRLIVQGHLFSPSFWASHRLAPSYVFAQRRYFTALLFGLRVLLPSLTLALPADAMDEWLDTGIRRLLLPDSTHTALCEAATHQSANVILATAPLHCNVPSFVPIFVPMIRTPRFTNRRIGDIEVEGDFVLYLGSIHSDSFQWLLDSVDPELLVVAAQLVFPHTPLLARCGQVITDGHFEPIIIADGTESVLVRHLAIQAMGETDQLDPWLSKATAIVMAPPHEWNEAIAVVEVLDLSGTVIVMDRADMLIPGVLHATRSRAESLTEHLNTLTGLDDQARHVRLLMAQHYASRYRGWPKNADVVLSQLYSLVNPMQVGS